MIIKTYFARNIETKVYYTSGEAVWHSAAIPAPSLGSAFVGLYSSGALGNSVCSSHADALRVSCESTNII